MHPCSQVLCDLLMTNCKYLHIYNQFSSSDKLNITQGRQYKYPFSLYLETDSGWWLNNQVNLKQPIYCRIFTVQTLDSQYYCCLDVISCSLVGRCQCFGGICCIHLQSPFYPEDGGSKLVPTYHTKHSPI